ncbi:MAG: PBECR4 domain-containing protein [Acetivibrio ethanolgignens]
MDDLVKKYNDYIRLKNCRVEYVLSNGAIIDFTYKEENFVHLLGLHKLADIQLIQLFNDKNNKKVQTKYIISRIKKGKFTDAMIKASVFYSDIAERYENFSYETLTTLTYTDAVINFNPNPIHSKIKSDYLLFEKKANKEYNHLGIAFDTLTGARYIETFFHHPTDMYIAGQIVVKVKSFTLYSPDNHIIVTDSF